MGLPMERPLRTVVLACLLALGLGALPSTRGSAGGAWDAGNSGAGAEVQVWSHQLMNHNFSESLARATEPWALVEFFASWWVLPPSLSLLLLLPPS